ncbi:aminotransferase class V-fold PLP-dependent enzyme [Nonomuraea sp. NPDC050404]|uniref:pyridoxal phosphate-dependent decarboxylase family protein n=1 Tax=Nonomuraea sp. NPDC050404 TaxID=3155783 RepID=UPI0034091DD3
MHDAPKYPLEPDRDEARAMSEAAFALVEDFLRDLPHLPAFDPGGATGPAAALRGERAPEHGTALSELLPTIAEGARSGATSAGPGYLAYIPGGGLYTAAIADFLAAALNKYVTVWQLAPVFAQMEATVVRWLCDLFDYPATARGILTSGGSMANFSAVVAARTALLGENFLDGVLYVTDQTHASCAKSAMLAGFPRANVRVVPTLATLAMDPRALTDAIARDRAAGLRPFLIAASAGTTNTGAIDPLPELAAIARTEQLWLHVDAAYGGPFQLTERGGERLRGIEQADSITLDPHKAMFLPYGTGALIVRDGALLRAAHHVSADYLQDLGPEDEIPNFTEYSPELSRDFRGLRLWLPIKLHGLAAFRAALDEKLDLACEVHDELVKSGFEVPWRPELTAVAFRWLPERGDADAFNARLLERINAGGPVLLSSTRINGRYMLRVCVVGHRTHRDRVVKALEIIRTSRDDLVTE